MTEIIDDTFLLKYKKPCGQFMLLKGANEVTGPSIPIGWVRNSPRPVRNIQ